MVAAETKSPLVAEKDLPPAHHEKEEVGMLENEEKLSKENGERRNNGIGGADYGSDRSEERQPDVMDDHSGKTRSTFLFSHTSVISYVYHFFQIWYFIES